MAESTIKLLDTLLSNRIRVFSDNNPAVNCNTAEITVPTKAYMNFGGLIFSRYGLVAFIVLCDVNGNISATKINPIMVHDGVTFTISNTGNVVKIKHTLNWDTPIVLIGTPLADNTYKSLTVDYTTT